MTLVDMETLIRAGDFTSVAKALRDITIKDISRSDLVHYANVANRVNQTRIALRILQPVIRCESPALAPPSDSEKIEYAEALRRGGLIGEAKKILAEIDGRRHPIADLRMAFCLITQWKYDEAIPFLKNYVAVADVSDYSRAIAKVNLAAALVIERRDREAMELLTVLRADTQRSGHLLLHGNCLELMAQLYVRQGQCDEADKVLDEAVAAMSDPSTRFSLFIRKWKAISRSLRDQSAHADLIECRDAAIREMDWETQRECDLYIGFLKQDHDLLNKVCIGTPYSSYRKRIRELAGQNFQPSPAGYVWNQNQPTPVREVFDLHEGKLDSAEHGLERGQLMHRLLILLCADFYCPLSIGTAFSELFPTENFSQQGSSARICQLVNRLRKWMKAEGNVLAIEEHGGSYRLTAQPGIGIRVPYELPQLSPESAAWEKLTSQIPTGQFSKADITRLLGCSPTSAKRLLRWSQATGLAESIGSGPMRKYRLTA